MGGVYVCRKHGRPERMICISASLALPMRQGSLAGIGVHVVRTLSPDRVPNLRAADAYLDSQDFEQVAAYLASKGRIACCLVDRDRSTRALHDRLFMQKMKRGFRQACPACLADALQDA